MTVQRKLVIGVIAWLAAVTLLHLWLNTDLFDFDHAAAGRAEFRVGYLPVT